MVVISFGFIIGSVLLFQYFVPVLVTDEGSSLFGPPPPKKNPGFFQNNFTPEQQQSWGCKHEMLLYVTLSFAPLSLTHETTKNSGSRLPRAPMLRCCWDDSFIKVKNVFLYVYFKQ
jgi:hypothetical protein